MTPLIQATYIRHNFDSDLETYRIFWDSRLIGLHYKNIPSIKPEDYDSAGSKSLTRLAKYCQEGVLVAATYSEIEPSKILLGRIKAGSKIRPEKINGRYYKVVQMDDVKEISFIEYPVLAALQPRQGTLTGWPSAEKIVNSIYMRKSLEFEVYSLAPAQLEILCYEYLKCRGVIQTLLLPIGRSLPHIDIFGISHNKRNVIAQVTFSDNANELNEKMELLRKYKADKTILIFFGRGKYKTQDNEIKYLSIEKIFESLKKIKPYEFMLKKMINW